MKKKDKELLANIESLLSGEDIDTESMTDKELLTVAKFVKKFRSFRAVPDEAFKNNLKEKLLRQMQEKKLKDAEIEQAVLARYTNRRPSWRLATAIVAILVVAIGVIWAFEEMHPDGEKMTSNPTTITSVTSTVKPTTSSTTTTTQTTTTAATPSFPVKLQAEAVIPKKHYYPGEGIQISVTVKNISAGDITLGATPIVLSIIRDQTGFAIQNYATDMFTKPVPPNNSIAFSAYWNQRDADGNLVPPGAYHLELEDLRINDQNVTLQFTRPVDFEIVADTTADLGQLKTILEFNQPQTANGVTVTLQKLEMYLYGYKIYFTATPPPGYVAGSGLYPEANFIATADFYIDRGWIQSAGTSSVADVNGIQHTWTVGQPLPPTAEELLFVIHNIGNQSGEWEFVIPLH
ncbi:MAG: hypothetical protein PHE50_02730 [Dehalococcoidales bacterium]|nr:hypothetical protein [Dehalococcoidales bacterium]